MKFNYSDIYHSFSPAECTCVSIFIYIFQNLPVLGCRCVMFAVCFRCSVGQASGLSPTIPHIPSRLVSPRLTTSLLSSLHGQKERIWCPPNPSSSSSSSFHLCAAFLFIFFLSDQGELVLASLDKMTQWTFHPPFPHFWSV